MLSLKSAKDFAKVAAVCAVFVGGWEGLWLTVKPDRLAYNIPTGGYGETENVKLGETHTKEYWQALLAQKLPRYWAEIAPCIKVPISDNEMLAYTSFAYNVGSAGFCKSSAARKLNAGDHSGACQALMGWNHAGGREVQGLTNRRASERKLCLTPDAPKPLEHLQDAAEAPVDSKRLPEPSTGASKSQSGAKVAQTSAPLHGATKPSKAKPRKPAPICTTFLFWTSCTP